MSYQSKTTVVNISVWDWSEESKTKLSLRLNALRAVAVQIASLCQMDIMGFDTCVAEEECTLSVIYVNNGCSLDDIRRIMTPEVNKREEKYWMIQDFEVWQGLLLCQVTTRGANQTWD